MPAFRDPIYGLFKGEEESEGWHCLDAYREEDSHKLTFRRTLRPVPTITLEGMIASTFSNSCGFAFAAAFAHGS